MTATSEAPSGASFSQALEFFHLLYGNASEGHLNVWMLPSKRSSWYDMDGINPHSIAAQNCIEESKEQDVYFGVGLYKKAPKKNTHRIRGKADDVLYIPGLWADVDVGEHGFESKDDALRWLLSGYVFKPSIVVDSGSGLHAYWLFKEMMSIEDKRAAQLPAAWIRYLQANCPCHLDTVGDLARVLRVPGTKNWKASVRDNDVRILRSYDAGGDELVPVKYNPCDLESLAIFEAPTQVAVEDIPDVQVRKSAAPPTKKLLALMENSPQFKATYDRQRKDLSDQTTSGYIFALMLFALHAGWTDQEVVDLCAAWLEEQPDGQERDAKWFAKSLAKAKAKAKLADLKSGRIEELPESEALELISTVLKEKVEKITRHEPPIVNGHRSGATWMIHLANGEKVTIPSTRHIITYRMFKELVAEKMFRVIDLIKAPEWQNFAELFIRAAEIEEAPAETSEYFWLGSKLEEYVSTGITADSPYEVSKQQRKIYTDQKTGFRYFHWSGFERFLRMNCSEKFSSKELGYLLTTIGCVKKTWFNETDENDQRLRVALWQAPRAEI